MILERGDHRRRFRIALTAQPDPAWVCIVQADDHAAEVTELATPAAAANARRVCLDAIDQARAEGWTVEDSVQS